MTLFPSPGCWPIKAPSLFTCPPLSMVNSPVPPAPIAMLPVVQTEPTPFTVAFPCPVPFPMRASALCTRDPVPIESVPSPSLLTSMRPWLVHCAAVRVTAEDRVVPIQACELFKILLSSVRLASLSSTEGGISSNDAAVNSPPRKIRSQEHTSELQSHSDLV